MSMLIELDSGAGEPQLLLAKIDLIALVERYRRIAS